MRQERETTCSKCGEPIVWIRTKSGKSMPCNTEPVAIMSIEGTPRGTPRDEVSGITAGGTMMRGRRATEAEIAANPDRYKIHISHFATCPHAASFRRRGGGAT